VRLLLHVDGRVLVHQSKGTRLPLDFLKRRPTEKASVQAAPSLLPEDVESEDHTLKLTYRAKTSQGVRMAAGTSSPRELPLMLSGISQSQIELIEPLAADFQGASPWIAKPHEALQWINANHDYSPIARHALVVLESSDAVDPAFETLAVSMLIGELDTSGYPEFDAIVGGVASHWDEASGDMIVRAVAGWGGKGVRGDTDRAAQKLIAALFSNILASQHAVGISEVERPVPAAGSGGLVCAHCGFSSAHDRAFYCPKCGMRMVRG
jgi:hypothetical protein